MQQKLAQAVMHVLPTPWEHAHAAQQMEKLDHGCHA